MNPPLKIIINGQVMGGKNHINITRTGKRYPDKAWAAWRDVTVFMVRRQLPKGFKPFTEPVSVALFYNAGDHRRRDMPAIIDSIWHVLEKAGVVIDDELLWIQQSERNYSKESPGVTLILLTEVDFKARVRIAKELIFK